VLTFAHITEALLPLVYAAALAAYALAFFRRGEGFEKWRRPLLLSALGVHTLSIYARTMVHGHCLVYSPFEMMTLISFTVTLTYTIVEMSSHERGTGMFFIALALLLQTMSAMFTPSVIGGNPNPILQNLMVGIHISAALFGYTSFAISAVYGGLFLMLYHQIRSNKFGPFYQRLPSLQLLERMCEKSAIVGIIFLGVAIAIGLIYLPKAIPGFKYTDAKLVATIAIWAIYTGALGAKYLMRVEGRKVIIISLVGFFGTLLSMTIINLLVSNFHRFD
jgi:ABC-type uncharacterized transport system permease subunit